MNKEKTMEKFWSNLKWREINNDVKSFRLGDEPELIHVIKTGFKDKYIVAFEDAYEISIGDTFIGSKKVIEEKFNIKL